MIRLDSAATWWICGACAVALWGWVRLDRAEAGTAAARGQLAATSRDVARLAELRGGMPAPVRGRRPQDDLVDAAQKALVASGLPIAAFSGIQPRADQTAGGLRIQSVQLRLLGLRPGEFGAWLAAWSTPEQPWRLGEMQLTHAQTPPTAGAAPLDTNRFDCTLMLTAPYVEDTP